MQTLIRARVRASPREPAAPRLDHATASVGPRALFATRFAPLPDAGAACIGLSIAWERHPELRAQALAWTSPAEQAHAARFLRPEDSLRHLLGRALLRCAAAQLFDVPPMRALATGLFGKPAFAGAGFDANLSHAGNQVWVALSATGRVGVDVEAAASLRDADEVLASFHPFEIAAIGAAQPREPAALRCWTRKEAVAKALGLGLSLPLRDYAVACGPAATGWLRQPPPGTAQADWTTTDLPVDPGYHAALAVHGGCAHVAVLRLAVSQEG